ncbi:MAG TPA: NAD(P)-dependent oxidoreductase [Pseudonocardiaceae bacterium]|jgi:nucleoside-diphosphate-sugar epimerase|nr:NAD(P)-dependent oxidoreductase [Pseudonocardiaceae bacterium]
MRVLVTGAGGGLGRETVERLHAEGHVVRAHDRVDVPGPADEIVTGELRDTDLTGLMTGLDAVVHAAALPSPGAGTEDEVFTNNVNAAYRVLYAAGRAGIKRVVYISSLSALGIAWAYRDRSPESVPITEDHPYLGEDTYGLSKYVGELIADTAARRFDATVISLRFPFLGTGERLRTHIAGVVEDPAPERVALWGWLDTRDAAGAIAAALTASAPPGNHVVNVVAPDTTSLIPTRELMARYHPTTRVDAGLSGFSTPFDTTRARELLAFTPAHQWRTAA